MKSRVNFYKQLIKTFIVSKPFSEKFITSIAYMKGADGEFFQKREEDIRVTQKILRESFIRFRKEDLDLVASALTSKKSTLQQLLYPLYTTVRFSNTFKKVKIDLSTIWMGTIEVLLHEVNSYRNLKELISTTKRRENEQIYSLSK